MLSFDGGGSVSAAVIHHSASGGITMTAALLLALLAAFLVTLVWGLGLTLLVDTIVGARRRLLGVFLLEHLYALARMELPLGRGLGECATRMWANSRHDVSLIARSLNAGVPLGDALSLTTAENPAGPIPPRRLISPAEAEILRIGESSGNLVEALRLVTQERRRSAEARSLLFAGFLYPMLVIILTSGVVALIFWQILPKFRKMFEELDVQAPSILMLNHLGLLWRILPFIGFVLMLFFVLLLFLPALHRPLQRARGHISDLVLRLGSFLPGIGGNMRRAALGEFCYELAMLVRAGVPRSPRAANHRLRDDPPLAARPHPACRREGRAGLDTGGGAGPGEGGPARRLVRARPGRIGGVVARADASGRRLLRPDQLDRRDGQPVAACAGDYGGGRRSRIDRSGGLHPVTQDRLRPDGMVDAILM